MVEQPRCGVPPAPRAGGSQQTSCRRTWLHLASLVEERGDLPGYLLEFVDLAVGGDEVREYSAAVEPFLLETGTLARGGLARFLRGALAGQGLCLRLLPTLALFLGLARGLGLQPAALGGEPLLLGLARGLLDRKSVV